MQWHDPLFVVRHIENNYLEDDLSVYQSIVSYLYFKRTGNCSWLLLENRNRFTINSLRWKCYTCQQERTIHGFLSPMWTVHIK